MKRILFFTAILLAVVVTTYAQSSTSSGASITIGAFATANNINSINANNVGLSLAGEFKYDRLTIGGEVTGHDNRPARARYFGTFDAFQFKRASLYGGGGYYRTGKTNGGFGQAGLIVDRFTGWGRYGNKNFIEAHGQFAVLNLDHFAVAPFYRYTRQDLDLAPRQVIHTGGLLFTLR